MDNNESYIKELRENYEKFIYDIEDDGECECDRLHLESELSFCFTEMLNKHWHDTKKIRSYTE